MTVVLDGLPWESSFVFARTVLSPIAPGGLSPHQLWGLAIAAVILLVLAVKVLRDVGLTTLECVALIVVAPLVAHVEAPLWDPAPNASLAMNAAGFLVPLAVALKMLAEGRAPFWWTMLALGLTTAVAYMSSYAVPNEGVLLYYRLPAVTAAVLALVIAHRNPRAVGPIAFVAGAGGVIVGADALRIHELLVTPEQHRIIVGGAGVFDGIFLVGILAPLIAAFGIACLTSARKALAPLRDVDESPVDDGRRSRAWVEVPEGDARRGRPDARRAD